MFIRKSNERGRGNYGWLKTRYTFSFANYYDPAWMGYHGLRVLNEDHIAPNGGFPTHAHSEMEIITYVISGAIAHRDSMGNEGVLRAGEVQVMSAGTGLTHSEFNASSTEELHLLQIWIVPAQSRVAPRYDQKEFLPGDRENRLVLIAGPGHAESAGNALVINADANVYAANMTATSRIDYAAWPGRHTWLQVVKGSIDFNGIRVEAGDGIAFDNGAKLESADGADLLLFDLGSS